MSEYVPIWKRPEGRLNSGASMLGEEEVEEVLAVIRSGCLSRDYGPDSQQAVLRFEQAIANALWGVAHCSLPRRVRRTAIDLYAWARRVRPGLPGRTGLGPLRAELWAFG